MLKVWITVLAVFSGACMANAQGYHITAQVDGLRDSTVLLAVYSGANKYARDTAKTDSNGRAVFTNNTPLAGGMYMLVAGHTQLCDFLISDESACRLPMNF